MLKGLIDFLISSTFEAKILRKNYIFFIIPMLNPDGIRYGNNRCSLLGVDLNRKWVKPNCILHPTIYSTKALLKHVHQEREILMFTDFHGHSSQLNVFMYGCSYDYGEFDYLKKNSFIRICPLLLSQLNPCFSYRDCSFSVEKAKSTTARIVAFKELNIQNSYTIEASYYGFL